MDLSSDCHLAIRLVACSMSKEFGQEKAKAKAKTTNGLFDRDNA